MNDQIKKYMKNCRICPRNCGADRTTGATGFCRVPSDLIVGRAALHHWEESCISGKHGSGAVFFSGCSLRCVYCQNHRISGTDARLYGKKITVEQLAGIFLKLQNKDKAENINLITATPYIPQVAAALALAKNAPSTAAAEDRLHIPVIFNCGGYEKPESLALLNGLVDAYLPDFKYMESALAKEYSHAPDYPETAKNAIKEMYRQTGPILFDKDGMLRRGIIVRHLLLPGHVQNGMKIIDYLMDTYGHHIYLSLMNQYTPVIKNVPDPLLLRKVTKREYGRLVDYAIERGVENAFIQEGRTAAESFIPAFDSDPLLIGQP